MVKKYYFASVVVYQKNELGNKTERGTLTIIGWNWFWVNPDKIFKSIKKEIKEHCDKEYGENGWSSVSFKSFNRV